MQNAIAISNIRKAYCSGSLENVIFRDFSIDIERSHVVSLVGPSGCGKSTLLNIVARLDTADSGDISINPGERMAYMTQDASLLPWRTLAENAVLGVEVVYGKNRNCSSEMDFLFEAFDLVAYKQTYPEASSGGMKQRAALIRTLLLTPSLMLLDEPFSNLDFDIKLNIQRYLLKYHRERSATVLLVTHDIEDAIALSDKVVVLSEKPTAVKAEIEIDLGLEKRDPVDARKSPRFREYFIQIWDELKYLDNHENS